ncbi:MAG: sensor histidine kinase [Bernardetiaceae bacterium]|nr:sensor histidine kinase [Bernardetiaceae bacterium]
MTPAHAQLRVGNGPDTATVNQGPAFDLAPYAQVLALPPPADYQPLDLARPPKTVWLGLHFFNPGPGNQLCYLDVAATDEVRLYRAPEAQPVAVNGHHYPLLQASVPSLAQYVALAVPPGAHDFQVWAAGIPPDQPPSVWLRPRPPTDNWLKHLLWENLVVVGALVIMGLYNLLLFGLVKDRSFLYYALHNLGVAGWLGSDAVAAAGETAFSYFSVELWGRVGILGFDLAYLGFVRTYFNGYDAIRRWRWPLWLCGAVLLAGGVVLASELVTQTHYFSEWLLLVGSAATPIVGYALGLQAWWRGYPPARYYTTAATLLLVGVLVMVGVYILWPDDNTLVRDIGMPALKLGFLADALLLAYALAWRYNQLKEKIAEKERENQRLEHRRQEEARVMIEEQNRALELKVAERTRSLQQANEAKDRLLAIISHDLRSPVASLESALQLQEFLPLAEREDFNQALAQQVGHLRQTIDNLLNWAYAQRGGLRTQPTVVDLRALAQEKIQLFGPTAKTKQISLHNQLPAPLWAWADAQHVRLVLHNLLGNALKFTNAGGHVYLRGLPTQGRVEVEVADTGTGIAPEKIGQLFNLATHFSEYGTAGESGTGLGLLVCHEMLEKNQGRIWVTSQPGQGTQFFFSLPTAEVDQPVTAVF